MQYISAASTISHQPTFRNKGFSENIGMLAIDAPLLSPDYKAFIEPALLRRMSKILRMSVACGKDCLQQAEIEQPGAIIVGTGLGCLQDTEKFLNNVMTVQGLLPPTAFIQSTHNTIAGQISLSIGNHAYNMTHTQNTVSFENALLDALLLSEEGTDHILLGAADEYIAMLSDITSHVGLFDQAILTSGASFFVVSNQKTDRTLAAVRAVESYVGVKSWEMVTELFLSQNGLDAREIGMVLLIPANVTELDQMKNFFQNQGVQPDQCLNVLDYSGVYPTASAFAFHFGMDKLSVKPNVDNILICNYLNKNNIGLMILQAVEA